MKYLLAKLTLCIFSVGNAAVNKATRLGMWKNKCSWMSAGTSVFSATNKAQKTSGRDSRQCDTDAYSICVIGL